MRKRKHEEHEVHEIDDPFIVDGRRVYSIRQINDLPEERKLRIYRTLIPERVLIDYGIDPITLRGPRGQLLVKVNAPPGTSFVKVEARHTIDARDPVLYLEMGDTVNNQLEVLLFVVNDPTAPRFDVDRDWRGQRTKFGTLSRNIPEEIRAMEAGLAPGQVRRGLRLTRHLIPVFERFVSNMGHDTFFIEPLAYHNAILFERYGFSYVIGRRRMEWINAEFAPGGVLYQRLDNSTPFRRPEFAFTVRGRSWAIHDGILDEPWGGVRMYKRVGHHAGICTFPNATY